MSPYGDILFLLQYKAAVHLCQEVFSEIFSLRRTAQSSPLFPASIDNTDSPQQVPGCGVVPFPTRRSCECGIPPTAGSSRSPPYATHLGRILGDLQIEKTVDNALRLVRLSDDACGLRATCQGREKVSFLIL